MVIVISILCILIGSPFVKGEIQSKTLLPNQYWGLGIYMQTGETLNFRIESDPKSINIYIMNDAQIELYQDDPQDFASYYIRQWTSYTLLTNSFVAPNTQQYWVLMINPSDITSTYVVIDASIDEAPVPKSITINSPSTNDVFDNGNNYIRWSTTGDINYIRIELYYSGSFLEVIDSYEYNDGSYTWYLSSDDVYSEGSYYQIKISDYYDESIYIFSNYFTIEIDKNSDNSFTPAGPEMTLLAWLLFIILPAIAGVVIVVVLVRRHKRKNSGEPIIV